MRLAARGRFHRGILILPSLFTLGNLFCGFYVLREATDGRWFQAAAFIALAMILDGLDGKIARLAHATSPLGIQLDSLADVVSFGVAPGFLIYTWALHDLGRLGWAVAFIYTSCGAIRLARFNVQADTSPDNRYFIGLPIPGAAGAIAGLIVLIQHPVNDGVKLLVAGLTLVLALLMVSTIRYRSFKQVDVAKRRPVRTLLWVVLGFAVVSLETELALATTVFLYTLSGPLARAAEMLRGTRAPIDDVSNQQSAQHADELASS